MTSSPATLPVGVVIRSHGVRGEVKVRCYAPESQALARVKRIELVPAAPADVSPEELGLLRARPTTNGVWIVAVEGISTRDQSDARVGSEVRVARDALPELAEGEWYGADLVGYSVQGLSGEALGEVESLSHTGGQWLAMLRHGAVRRLVPMVEPLLSSVDVERRTLVMDLPEGLPEEPAASPHLGRPRPR
jgi:16S rRNA processing protein RimM